MTIEETFSVEIPTDDYEKITTVQSAIDYIQSRLAPGNRGSSKAALD